MNKADFDEIFESADIVLAGAHEAGASFAAALTEEYRSATLEYAVDSSLLPGAKVYRYSINSKPSAHLRRQAYRAVSDIRHALDQTVYAASRALGSPPKKGAIYFPFAADPEDFETLFDRKKKGRCRDTHPSLIPTLRALTPWWRHPETGTGDNILRTLGKLSGPNKHQVIIEFAPEMISSRNSTGAGGFVWAQVIPPLRLDRFNAEFPDIQIPPTRHRTDFIAAVTPTSTDLSLQLDARVSLCAKEATRVALPIDVLMREFLARGTVCIERIKGFTFETLVT